MENIYPHLPRPADPQDFQPHLLDSHDYMRPGFVATRQHTPKALIFLSLASISTTPGSPLACPSDLGKGRTFFFKVTNRQEGMVLDLCFQCGKEEIQEVQINKKVKYSNLPFTDHGMCPGWCGSVNWVLTCGWKGHRFNSQSGHMPELQAETPAGVNERQLINVSLTQWCFSPSLSPSLPFSLKINK